MCTQKRHETTRAWYALGIAKKASLKTMNTGELMEIFDSSGSSESGRENPGNFVKHFETMINNISVYMAEDVAAKPAVSDFSACEKSWLLDAVQKELDPEVVSFFPAYGASLIFQQDAVLEDNFGITLVGLDQWKSSPCSVSGSSQSGDG